MPAGPEKSKRVDRGKRIRSGHITFHGAHLTHTQGGYCSLADWQVELQCTCKASRQARTDRVLEVRKLVLLRRVLPRAMNINITSFAPQEIPPSPHEPSSVDMDQSFCS